MKGIIFDLDGTLYMQKPVRLWMFVGLAKYYCLHFWKWRELYGIYIFRSIREKDAYKDFSVEQQIEYTSKRVKMNQFDLYEKIQYWMFRYPLFLIDRFKNVDLLQYLRSEQNKGKKIIIYSDYPVEDKLNCLKIEPDAIFYPGINGINSLKPSATAMQNILNRIEMKPEELLFIGDRKDKDGESARLAGIPFVLVNHK